MSAQVMEDATLTSLPDDPRTLKAMVLSLTRRCDEVARRCDEVTRRCDEATTQRDEATRQRDQWKLKHDEKELDRLRLEVELLRLKKWYYGPRADQLTTPEDVAQMLLSFGEQLEARPVDLEDVPAEVDLRNVEVKTIRRVKRGRRNLAAFDELPVTRKEHDLPEDQKPCPCCGQMRCRIGSETSWQLEYIPGRFERIEHIRHRYACKHCDQNGDGANIELADKPTQPIEKGMAAPGLLAYVVTSKFADYLPLYRLESIFQRNGFEIDRATQSIWCRDVAETVKPVYDLMVQRVLQSHVISTDDTVMPMLAPGHGRTRQGRMWIYLGDEDHPYNLFDFTLSRSRDGPVKFLGEYKQTLLADGYGGYDGVVTKSDITRAGCWAHARRKFVEAEKTHPTIARDAVTLIKRLYAVEEQARSLNVEARPLNVEARLQLRQSQSTPILRELHERLLNWKEQLVPKHPMAQAIGYALNQWQELNVFAADGAVAIDNNASEREMKRIVLNRKNSLFVGNPRGGQTAAILASLTSTCRRHQIDPQLYLTQLLTNLPGTPISQLTQWLPDQWKQNHLAPQGV
jgi:transposase